MFLLGGAFVLLASTCSASEDETSRGSSDDGTPRSTATTAPEPTPDPTPRPPTPEPTPIEPSPIELSGSGEAASEKFDLVGGLTVFRVTCSSGGTCSIWVLHGSSGERVELIANDHSPYEGSTAVGMDSGEYLLDVDTPGPWMVKVEQPRPTTGPSLPHNLEGSGQSAIGPLRFPSGLVMFDIDCPSQEGICSIWLFDSDGDRVELLANDRAPHSATKPVGLQAGVYWLDIDAEAWSIATRRG